MTTIRLSALISTAAGVAVFAIGCSSPSSSSTASDKPRKLYYSHDVATGSHMPKAYTEPTPIPAVAESGIDAGDRPFVNSTAGGTFPAGAR